MNDILSHGAFWLLVISLGAALTLLFMPRLPSAHYQTSVLAIHSIALDAMFTTLGISTEAPNGGKWNVPEYRDENYYKNNKGEVRFVYGEKDLLDRMVKEGLLAYTHDVTDIRHAMVRAVVPGGQSNVYRSWFMELFAARVQTLRKDFLNARYELREDSAEDAKTVEEAKAAYVKAQLAYWNLAYLGTDVLAEKSAV